MDGVNDVELSDEEKRAIILERIMETPEYLPITWRFDPATVDGKPAIIGLIRTPAYRVRPVLLRDGAVNMAKDLLRAAGERGGGIYVPESAGKLAVPEGR